MSEKPTDLLNAYLVVGNDELKAQTVIKKLWARMEQLGAIDFNSQILDGTKEIDTRTLVDSLNTPPLASPIRVVVIKEVDKAGQALTEALIDYLKSPMPSTVLVMSATKLTEKSRLLKAVRDLDKKAVIDASEKKRSEIPAMVRQLAQGYHIHLSQEAAVKVAELVGSSTLALNSEVKKLASYVLAMGKSSADLNDVITVIARTSQPSAWDFVEAFSRRELAGGRERRTSRSEDPPAG
ncbi:MAG: hypothetical protein LBP91_00835, partial [Coriobacteriales bacterium]|nr:hypothetical protein [Coriobacteriales bacterium]